MALEMYKRFFGHRWACTEVFDEVPQKIWAAMSEEVGLDPATEKPVLVAYVDTLGSKGNFFVIVTQDRIVTRNPSQVDQAIFKDVRTIDKTTDNVKIRAEHKEFVLFHKLVVPKAALTARIFAAANRQWLAQRKA